ncbi:uncharacterized protein LOC108113886 [Drosophila eugracilis]|uniref:uncharacterized protein LOC108113886 n=1 Tax=Drosophila eugracilis TaxID=29029 RepID=UPI0007E73C0D|nr:uncharacterized protein LOC108113886 [Drosophila eugracilis]
MRRLLYIITIFGFAMEISSHVTFTNLKCSVSDKKFMKFEKCYIKAVNRTHKYIDVHANLYQLPVDNIMIRLRMMRNDHGFKPFFIDMSFDACKFMKNQKNPILNLFYGFYKKSSNINHTCPFNHDLIVDHMWTGNMETEVMNYLPIKNGDYAVFSDWSTNNVLRASLQLYVRVTEN